MLTRIEINGFKSLNRFEFQPAQINVLIGANGSGKSNILEAIGLLGAAASGRVDDQSLLRRGVRAGVPALYKTSLKGVRLLPAIYLVGDWSDPLGSTARYSAGINNPLDEPKPSWSYATESIELDGQTLLTRGPRGGRLGDRRLGDIEAFRPKREAGLAALARATEPFAGPPSRLLEALADFAIFAPVTPVLRGIAPDPAPRSPVGLFGGRLPEAVGPLLDRRAETFGTMKTAELFELLDWASDISISAPSRQLLSPSVPTARFVIRFKDRRMTRERNLLSGYDASEGALYVLFMLVLAMHAEAPQVLAIDNFDVALNPLLAKEVTAKFVDLVLESPNKRQVFLTTHQPQALDGLDLLNKQTRLFVVERDKTGATVVRPIEIDPKVLGAAGERFSLSRLWTMGRLGGVPQL